MPTTNIPRGSQPYTRSKQPKPKPRTAKQQIADAKALSFLQTCKIAGIPEPTTEYVFHDVRKWRFDYAWPEFMLALEVEGGVWSGGRHTRGSGFVSDVAKYNEASAMGWLLIRCVPKDLQSLDTIHIIQRAIRARVGG